MKKYLEPVIEVVEFNAMDVMTTSGKIDQIGGEDDDN